MTTQKRTIIIVDADGYVYYPARVYDTWRGIFLFQNYTLGKVPAHYPVPVTLDTAMLSVLHQPEELKKWTIPWAKQRMRT